MPTWHSVHFGCRPTIMSALRKDNKETWCANNDVYPQAVSSTAPGPETPMKSYPEQSRIVALPHHLALEGGLDVVGVSLKHSSGLPRRGGLSCRAIVWCERLDLSSLLNIHGFANANPQSILVVVQRPRTLPPGRQSLASSCLNRGFIGDSISSLSTTTLTVMVGEEPRTKTLIGVLPMLLDRDNAPQEASNLTMTIDPREPSKLTLNPEPMEEVGEILVDPK
ncbi:hypothetical protein B296_00009161 [Ensete ventricosum]|uniref:Uncharacterized protein n=1 Tax=Ensete ventricosum TaxID=4639 RepID=A0A427A3L5_ENSVE|nr:hypothetical protein B296_00009161 [Ensete ventricosum]